ncbi:bifunctional 4-hydroxy-2-oxoglutarate aldolase/2-dehydro-3-deoxy-phosphogluconate aldolase [Flavivirga sp. 57AJ16]|uniref:bifunctional 4-hydroxy-2-oxoglutarate aldolase/2-dehydro-3-deoxy-phosphogluconate aldolase n=1 Tax=Flavivirga sp. 57AJ16 TaxID=3025307 RepID=UPI0023651EF1|nr:bifunctional 4-hydroxy-2-oxoglutarate aldolase/2-dehydro-3-deoxy-phosphogluconate aldolase [Flavivirga sp. 57AJ16]MDD7887867.1 bifunctional 4-hydroxy-2-oxoglutarate aldolase/2-dehydro-3-deoxy-phosphogluconate aldolase [Flavivirga sp. 57AJ16]
MKTRNFLDALKEMPIVPALRGLKETEAKQVGQTLLDSGITIFEVPIRTGNAAFSEIDTESLKCIEILIDSFGKYVNISAGTVMNISDLEILAQYGINSCLSIYLNDKLLQDAKKREFTFLPAVETITEAITASKLGANGLKIFPSVFKEADGHLNIYHSPGYIKYLSKFVSCPIIPSGNAFNKSLIKNYLSSGAKGINIGSQIYERNISLKELEIRIKNIVDIVKSD